MNPFIAGNSVRYRKDVKSSKTQEQSFGCFCKKGFLENFAKFTGKHLCQSLFFNKVSETPAQVLFCEFCEIFKNTYIYRTPLVAAFKNTGAKLVN